MVSQEELLQAAQDYGLDAAAAERVVSDISRRVDLMVFDALRLYVRVSNKSKEVTIP